MAKVNRTKEIIATTEDKVGMLAEVSSAIAEAGANITAICAYGIEGKAHFMIVTTNNKKAMAALEGKGCEVEENDVVEMELENKVGALSEASKKLKDADINLNYIYGTVGATGSPAKIIISSNNDDEAVQLLS